MYNFREWKIRKQMVDEIRGYIDNKTPPGEFLTAVICNDLKGAIWHADAINLANLPAFVGYFYNEAPAGCWGSSKIMKRWMAKKTESKS